MSKELQIVFQAVIGVTMLKTVQWGKDSGKVAGWYGGRTYSAPALLWNTAALSCQIRKVSGLKEAAAIFLSESNDDDAELRYKEILWYIDLFGSLFGQVSNGNKLMQGPQINTLRAINLIH